MGAVCGSRRRTGRAARGPGEERQTLDQVGSFRRADRQSGGRWSSGNCGPKGRAVIAVLDTASVSALAPDNEKARVRLRALRQRADDLVIPAAVLAEGLLTGHPGRDYHVRRFLDILAVADVDRALGMAAGALRTKAIGYSPDRPPSGVDATVAALADSCAANEAVEVITSDDHDMARLAAFGVHSDLVSIVHI